MKNDSLFYFNNPNDFKKFINSLNIYNDWKIGKGTMNSRGESIRNKGYTNFLRDKFNSKRMFRRSVSISEIVSWLDSFVIMRRFAVILLFLLMGSNSFSQQYNYPITPFRLLSYNGNISDNSNIIDEKRL